MTLRRVGVFAGFLVFGLTLMGLLPNGVAGQGADSGMGRKTIEISATERVQAIAEIATIKMGYENQAPTKDSAYAENTRVANRIVKSLLDAGVPKEAIETESVSLAKEEDRSQSKPAIRFAASQMLRIHAKAGDAQKVVDLAVTAGANKLEDVQWSVAEPKELEAKAYAGALARAKALAEQTASQAGVKLGEIVAIANSTEPGFRQGMAGKSFNRWMTVEVEAAKLPMLELHPAMVERDASVTVTYAIAP